MKIIPLGGKHGCGRFKDEELAARRYNEVALKHFGEFARLNII